MARVPDAAIHRRQELSHGAWNLYVHYCAHRNRATGRCDPGLTLLADEMGRTYRHISDCKTELVRKGWIRRTGKNAVVLLVGEFESVKVRQFGKNPNLSSENFRTSGAPTSGGIRTQVREESELGRASLITEPEKEPVAAATAAAATVAGSASGEEDPLSEVCDEAFVEEVLAAEVYSFEHVRWVWRKLRLHCQAKRTVPVKGQFLHWLSTERHTSQQKLPGVESGVVSVAARASPPATGKCDHTCPLCYGSGVEVVAGKGARRCSRAAAQERREVG